MMIFMEVVITLTVAVMDGSNHPDDTHKAAAQQWRSNICPLPHQLPVTKQLNQASSNCGGLKSQEK